MEHNSNVILYIMLVMNIIIGILTAYSMLFLLKETVKTTQGWVRSIFLLVHLILCVLYHNK